MIKARVFDVVHRRRHRVGPAARAPRRVVPNPWTHTAGDLLVLSSYDTELLPWRLAVHLPTGGIRRILPGGVVVHLPGRVAASNVDAYRTDHFKRPFSIRGRCLHLATGERVRLPKGVPLG